MKKYIEDNHNYWCETCEVIEILNNAEIELGDFILMKCDSSQPGAYYLGAVGPFDKNGSFIFQDDNSIYYNELKSEENPTLFVPDVIEYYKQN